MEAAPGPRASLSCGIRFLQGELARAVEALEGFAVQSADACGP